MSVRVESRKWFAGLRTAWRKESFAQLGASGSVESFVRHRLVVKRDGATPKEITVGTMVPVGDDWHGFSLGVYVVAHRGRERVKQAVYSHAALDLYAARDNGGWDAVGR